MGINSSQYFQEVVEDVREIKFEDIQQDVVQTAVPRPRM
jgi:hypothetical protein